MRPKVRGRRECRVLAAPAVSCAKLCKKRTRAYRYRRGHPDIPCAMVLRLIARSPRRRIRLVTVADGLKDCLNPVRSTRLRRLSTSNGCQNHTVLPYAKASFVCAPFGRSRVFRQPALRPHHAHNAAASTASSPASMTMANAPLGDRTARDIDLSRVCGEAEYFC